MCVCEATGAKVATTVSGGCGVSVKTRVVYLAGRTLMTRGHLLGSFSLDLPHTLLATNKKLPSDVPGAK